MDKNNFELVLENTMLKAMAEQVLALIKESSDNDLKTKIDLLFQKMLSAPNPFQNDVKL